MVCIGKEDAAEIKELRLTESLPVINELEKWIFEEIKVHCLEARLEKRCGTVIAAGIHSVHIYTMETY